MTSEQFKIPKFPLSYPLSGKTYSSMRGVPKDGYNVWLTDGSAEYLARWHGRYWVNANLLMTDENPRLKIKPTGWRAA